MASAPPSSSMTRDKENLVNTPTVSTKTNVARVSLTRINGNGFEPNSKDFSTTLKSPESKSEPTSTFSGNRSAGTPWFEGCGVDYPHLGGSVTPHCDGINSEITIIRGGIHWDLGNAKLSPKEYWYHKFIDNKEVSSCAIKVTPGMVTVMSRPAAGADKCRDGVVFKHSTRFCDRWVLIGFQGQYRSGNSDEKSVVKGMKGMMSSCFFVKYISRQLIFLLYQFKLRHWMQP